MDPKGRQQHAGFCAYPACMALGSDNLRCSRCKTTYYCTRIHQLNDVQHHKTECKAQAPQTPQPQRPGTRSLSVLLFPTDEDAPRIVQTECRIDSGPPGREDHHIDFTALLHTLTVTSLPIGPVEPAPPGAPRTRLYLAFDDCFALYDAPPNRAARALTGGRAHTPWAGTMFGYRAREPADEVTQFEDVGVEDVPAFRDFLAAHGAPPDTPAPEVEVSPRPDVDDGLEEVLARLRPQAQAGGAREHIDAQDEAFFEFWGPRAAGRRSPPEPEPRRERDEEAYEVRQLMRCLLVMRQEFTRQKTELRQIVAEETARSMLTTIALVLGAYGVWRCIVLPILALPGILFNAVVAVVGTILWCGWRVVALLFAGVVRGAWAVSGVR